MLNFDNLEVIEIITNCDINRQLSFLVLFIGTASQLLQDATVSIVDTTTCTDALTLFPTETTLICADTDTADACVVSDQSLLVYIGRYPDIIISSAKELIALCIICLLFSHNCNSNC